MNNQKKSALLFGIVTISSILVAIVYVILSAQRPKTQATAAPNMLPAVAAEQRPILSSTTTISSAPPSNPTTKSAVVASLPQDSEDEKQTISPNESYPPDESYMVSLNLQHTPDIGKVRIATLADPDEIAWITDLRCERVYFSGDNGICLSRVVENVSAYSVATIFDSKFKPQFQFKTDGIPSRARVSPEGRYGAFTVFVFGHSYADDNFSTATFILEMASGKPLANLEEFTVFQDGEQISFPDFNFWGVTFTQDSNLFYATLRFNRTPYLVKGDIQARKITILRPGIECPSLSPDETRIAFKKMISPAHWQLTVMDLHTLVETPLSESRSVDDQAEWLDNERVLFAIVDPSLPAVRSLMVVNADGTGESQLFASSTESPTVIRY